MNAHLRNLQGAISLRPVGQRLFRPSVSLGVIALVGVVGFAAYLAHFNLSTIGSIYLLIVVFISLRWGFVQATVASFAAVCCMNYFFIPPIFELQVTDPENWISIATFETAALIVSGLSSRAIQHAAQTEVQRKRTATLYELSRAILLIDVRRSTAEQLSALVCEIVDVRAVEFWIQSEAQSSAAGHAMEAEAGSAHATFLSDTDSDDPKGRTTYRVLRSGTAPIGAMVLRRWAHDSLLADAVASLAAIAFERARAIHKENRAEAERNTEQLRTAVLDGLAHGFKTPLTAIQTASSGLLAIDHMTPTQAELVSIIDEQATMLTEMTTRLLQTAALESREIHLHRARVSLLPFVEDLLAMQGEGVRTRLRIEAPSELMSIDLDPELMRLALSQLIDNSVKYSSVSRTIDLILQQTADETTIMVCNQGPPVDVEERDLIFERFYRGHNAAHGPAGTGVGLSIVKKTAEAHGGRAWVECDDEMTRFCFTMENYRGTVHG